jgi:hypothetical protein
MISDGKIISENSLSIHVGRNVLLNQKPYSLETLIVHDDYNHMTFEHDIALMKIKETFNFAKNIKAICYSKLRSLPHAASGIAVGYGSTDKFKQTVKSEVLLEVTMPIQDKDECFDSDQEFFTKHLFEGNFCAGNLNVLSGVRCHL